jgi:hypothetical protein
MHENMPFRVRIVQWHCVNNDKFGLPGFDLEFFAISGKVPVYFCWKDCFFWNFATFHTFHSAMNFSNYLALISFTGTWKLIWRAENQSPSKYIGVAPVTSGDTSSEQSFKKAMEWIQHCQKNHAICLSFAESPLPTRVLDVACTSSSTNLDIKLYKSQGEREPYICLSHRWGASHVIQTTKATLANHKRNISWSDLPRTFQDAISVTRRLNIRYLWIDTLCIIQVSFLRWFIFSNQGY